MAESWTISVGGQVYGPYSLEQMRAFHAEKRLAAHSLIARQGEEEFHHAIEDAEFAALFAPAVDPAAAQPARFGQRPETDTGSGVPGRFVIVGDMKERSIRALEDEIYSLGLANQIGPQAWVLSTQGTINTVRTALVQKLGKTDTLFIADCVNDKVAWFNYGPETDARIRKMWSRVPEPQGGEKRATVRT